MHNFRRSKSNSPLTQPHTHTTTMKNVFPSIPTVLPPKGQIPAGFRLMIHKWSYPETRLGEIVEIGGKGIKKMLTLDINIPDAGFSTEVNLSLPGSEEAKASFVRSYPCPHACPGCFNKAELENHVMTLKEVMDVVDQARKLGLESVKFLGPGELVANPDLFPILDAFAERNIIVGIFTKGIIMGSDYLCQKYHGISSKEMISRLTSYPNTTFLVGGRSFDPDLEKRTVPARNAQIRENVDNYESRNHALVLLCEAGMNADLSRQRLSIQCNPVTRENIEGVFEIYRWGVERNIPVYLPPTMVSGKGHKEEEKLASDIAFEDDYIDLAVNVYSWAIERGVMTLEQLKHEGAHPYIGVAPCNQLTHGLYIHYDGAVWRCPGNDAPNFIVHPNVRNAPLVDIWTGSKNYPLNKFNNRCVKDGFSLPGRFYEEVEKRVEERFRA